MGNFASDVLEPALGVKLERGTLDIGGAEDHARESEFAGRILGRSQHALSQPTAAPLRVAIHASQLPRVAAAAIDAERTYDPIAVGSLDDPKSAAPRRRENIEQVGKLSLDHRRNISIEEDLHPGGCQFPVHTRPQIGNGVKIGGCVRPKGEAAVFDRFRHTGSSGAILTEFPSPKSRSGHVMMGCGFANWDITASR